MEYQLALTFECTSGGKVTMVIGNVKPTLTETEIREAMDQIIEKKVFDYKYGLPVKKVSAMLTEQNIKDYKM